MTASDSPPVSADSATPSSSPRQRVVAPFRALGFWLAVVLPLVHVPLFVSGLSTTDETLAFAGLLVANLLALGLGRGYGQQHGDRASGPAASHDVPAAFSDD